MKLDGLLRPRSIAIVGASERPSIGRAVMESLERLGFEGDILPVNPKYQSVLNKRCHATLRDLPAAPDVIAFCVSTERILEGLRAAAEIGARGAVIYDGGFAERGDEGKRLQIDIAAMCREANIALCGPNCMGVLSPHDRSTTYMQEVRDTAGLAGTVALISQSGSICIGLLADIRRYGFSYIISSGNEAVVTCADYFDFLVDDPNTKTIAAFLETVREPQHFVAALDRAANAGKPVVVLKVGRSERTQRAITSHTGGLAGEGRVFSEVLRAHRAIEVSDLDEMSEVLAAASGARLPAGPRIGVVTASGGQAELILDVATEAGIDLPPLDAGTRAEAERVIGPLTGDGNPLDAWGNGDFAKNFPHALTCLDAAPECDAIVMCSDAADFNPMGRIERPLDYAQTVIDAAKISNKPHYMMGTRPGVMQRAQVDLLRKSGIAALGGARQGLGAVARLGRRALPRGAEIAPSRDRRLSALVGGSKRATVHEADVKRLLAEYGLPVTREILATDWNEVRRAADQIGWPVALKIVSDRIAHKSEHGLVALSIADEAELRRAHDRLLAAASKLAAPAEIAGVLVQEMVRGGIEAFVGVNRDPDFGLVIAAGIGGIGIDVLKDFALRLLPLREGDAAAMITEIKAYPLLRGARSASPYDIDAFTKVIEEIGKIAHANQDVLGEIDLNPVIVFEAGRGCRIVDALIIPRGVEAQEENAA